MLRFEELPKVNSKQWLDLVNLPEEEWRDVPQFEGLLKVSNYARVMKLPKYWSPKKMILKQISYGGGYYAVSIRYKMKQIKLFVHRLVASAFIENPEHKPFIDHINTNKRDNVYTNLRWVTHKENMNNPLTIQQRPKRYNK